MMQDSTGIGMFSKDELKVLIRQTLIEKLKVDMGLSYVPVAVSARHIHLSRKEIDVLFGAGYTLKPIKKLSQPGQYACEETITLAGPKGSLKKVRVLGPERLQTQVELSITDCLKLGIEPMIRMSGNINETPGCSIIAPNSQIEIDKGVIVAMRHLHISTDEARIFNVNDGDNVSVRKVGNRDIVLGNVTVRCGSTHRLEVHIDTDEANAGVIKTGDLLELLYD